MINKSEHFKKYKINFKWLFLIFLVILFLSYYGIKYIKNLTSTNISNNINEFSEQTTAQLENTIKNQKSFVELIVDTINRGYFKTEADILNTFSDDIKNYNFTRLFILDKNGNGVSNDGYKVENYSNIQEFFAHDDVYLSDNRPSIISDNQINIYSKTFTFNNEEKVLFATINTQDYKDILVRRLFDGKAGTFLINENGVILINSFDDSFENNVNIYDYMLNKVKSNNLEDAEKINNMHSNIQNKVSGIFEINYGKDTYFVQHSPTNINNWSIISVIPSNAIGKELNQFLVISLAICIIANIVVIIIYLYIDISNQHKNLKLYNVAYIDSLTSLGNELYFKENSDSYLKNSAQNKYIISIDINKFKSFNIMYGYDFSNHIITALSQKITEVLPDDNITARMYNDVFVSIFSYDDGIKNLLDKIIENASNINVDNKFIHLNLSIGVYKIKPDEKDINKLVDKAYIARSKIKGSFYDNYYIFDEELENKILKEQEIELSMEEALKNNEFKVLYQPKFYTDTEKLAGAEALVRWYKGDTIIPPNEFIPLFEKDKFILKLDLYIFEKVCSDMCKWKEQYGFTPTVSINVSKEHFVNANFIDDYIKITNKYGIERNKIDLEITESATIDKNIDIITILNNIKEKGFIISVDDFGTGYSSLSLLQNMKFDIIKIDKSFLDNADLNSNKNIFNYIVLISKYLEVKIIVEGVETIEQLNFVRNLKCDIIQGYYYSKPLVKEEFENYLKGYNI